MSERHAWIDASAGVAGDMLLGALLDAGASLPVVQAAVEAVVPGAVRMSTEPVTRAGLRATKAVVDVRQPDQPHRRWLTLREMLTDAALAEPVRRNGVAVFERLAAAEGAVHGIPPEDVEFHEVGSLDSIADIIGVCAALDDLGVTGVSAGPVAVGSGRTSIAHGEVGIPVPAVVELARGWRVHAGGAGELATPTGMALIVTLAGSCTDLPTLRLAAAGTGAGTRDVSGRANVTRVIIGEVQAPAPDAVEPAVQLEANVDDLDPRLWPGVLTTLLAAGASDAWLVPVLMKKGRPAHVLSVLCAPEHAPALRDVIFSETSTLGVRAHGVGKYALPRGWTDVEVGGQPVTIKVAHRGGTIVRATPEFESVTAAATELARPQADVLAAAVQAAGVRGLLAGAPVPPLRSTPDHP